MITSPKSLSGEHGFEGLPLVKPSPCASIWKAKFIAPLFHGLRLSVVCYRKIISSVVCLLVACGPTTVLGAVVSINDDAINAEPVFPCGNHVFKEGVFVLPSVAHFYSAFPVVNKHGRVFVYASLPHRCPASYNGMIPKSGECAFKEVAVIGFRAAATLGDSMLEVAMECDVSPPAFAQAIPSLLLPPAWGSVASIEAHDCRFTEGSAGEVFSDKNGAYEHGVTFVRHGKTLC